MDEVVGDANPVKSAVETGPVERVAFDHLRVGSNPRNEHLGPPSQAAQPMTPGLQSLDQSPAHVAGGTGEKDERCFDDDSCQGG